MCRRWLCLNSNDAGSNMMIKNFLTIAVLLASSVASADTVALSSSRSVGNQSYGGALGMDFDVLSTITITQLGAFDSGLDGFSSGTVQVGIFNRNSGALAGTSASFIGNSSVLSGNQRFIDVVDFTLSPGQYSIVAVGFSATNRNGNFQFGGTSPVINTGGGLISFVGASRYSSSTSLTFPNLIDGGGVTQYDAGTFQFTSAIPEPGTSLTLLMGVGLGLLVFGRGRSRGFGDKLAA